MTLDEVKRTAQQQMTRVLKDQSRLVYFFPSIFIFWKKNFYVGFPPFSYTEEIFWCGQNGTVKKNSKKPTEFTNVHYYLRLIFLFWEKNEIKKQPQFST